ncbi:MULTISPECIES: MBL fold metallo-hydrolase [unclassified Nocardioides]|uniref:MBL fold metallo-hydrolase n=1 Tax=unclassified Nocardioides TaxID=2615069 RepID=UPI000700E154|nr:MULTISPECIES: MBL fold metallo-hydrolase [unclassified Nocardioides]KQY56926.1 MBL fold metallo-hydrolase [Nocardioides sp. Root140]KRF13048.1 MBL fold metallo-hydrolase [Nocardioides sp. Soil796]
MRITKFGHACVRLEAGGQALVFDPGMFTEPSAVDGATAVLITHEHADHYDASRLRATDAPIFTIEAVAAQIREHAPDVAERVTVVEPGQSFDAGLPVRAVGELHAVIHPEFPRFFNSGYVVESEGQSVYHPGDALTLPDQRVDVLLVPSSAPWLKVSEAIDFTRAVDAPLNLAIHDRIYTEAAHRMLEGHMAKFLPDGHSYVRRADGEDL